MHIRTARWVVGTRIYLRYRCNGTISVCRYGRRRSRSGHWKRIHHERRRHAACIALVLDSARRTVVSVPALFVRFRRECLRRASGGEKSSPSMRCLTRAFLFDLCQPLREHRLNQTKLFVGHLRRWLHWHGVRAGVQPTTSTVFVNSSYGIGQREGLILTRVLRVTKRPASCASTCISVLHTCSARSPARAVERRVDGRRLVFAR